MHTSTKTHKRPMPKKTDPSAAKRSTTSRWLSGYNIALIMERHNPIPHWQPSTVIGCVSIHGPHKTAVKCDGHAFGWRIWQILENPRPRRILRCSLHFSDFGAAYVTALCRRLSQFMDSFSCGRQMHTQEDGAPGLNTAVMSEVVDSMFVNKSHQNNFIWITKTLCNSVRFFPIFQIIVVTILLLFW